MTRFKRYLIFVSIAFILFFCVALSEQQIVRDFAKGVSYANFVRNENQRLNTDLLDSLNVQNFSDCGGKCLIHRNCTSVNYGDGNGQGEHICEILASDKFTSPQQLTVDYTFQHFSVASPCDKAPCVNGGTCVPLYEEDSYSCQCPLLFLGQDCEEKYSGRSFSDSSGDWTAFWWIDGSNTPWPAGENDVLAYAFGHCKAIDPYCFGRLPLAANEDSTEMLAVDSYGTKYKWSFDSSNTVVHAAWRAFHDHQTIPYGEARNQANPWTPQVLSGNAPAENQDSFMYRDQYGVRSILLDDDACDCKSSLNIGHGMCNSGDTPYGASGQYGVDSLYDPGCQVPRYGVGLILFFRTV